jgi:hypothetical protein
MLLYHKLSLVENVRKERERKEERRRKKKKKKRVPFL